MSPCVSLENILRFLDKIGIKSEMVEGATGFLEKVRITHGALLVDPTCPVSNLLHDAGHLAILPSQYRRYAGKNADRAVHKMMKDVSFERPGSRLLQIVTTCSDAEATAWAWAAGIELGIPRHLIILDSEYLGAGGLIRHQLEDNSFPGVRGLVLSGMTDLPGTTHGFPTMRRWVQPAIALHPKPALLSPAMG